MQQGIRVRVGAVIVRNSAIVLVEYDDDKSGRHFNRISL
jgi:deoxycytidylate deaminase